MCVCVVMTMFLLCVVLVVVYLQVVHGYVGDFFFFFLFLLFFPKQKKKSKHNNSRELLKENKIYFCDIYFFVVLFCFDFEFGKDITGFKKKNNNNYKTGNKAAVFPLQLFGFDVDPINSVQLSNHTGKFTTDVPLAYCCVSVVHVCALCIVIRVIFSSVSSTLFFLFFSLARTHLVLLLLHTLQVMTCLKG